jgi:hypothetical protein
MTPSAEIIRRIVTIGLLPKSGVRDELIAAYGDESALTTLVPIGVIVEHELKVSDVEVLPPDERVAFLKGASLILGPALKKDEYCICNMRAAVILPVASFASLLRDDVVRARKAWPAFAKIPRLCAERLPLDRAGRNGRLSFEEFVLKMGQRNLHPVGQEFSDLAQAAAAQIDEAYDLAVRRREFR